MNEQRTEQLTNEAAQGATNQPTSAQPKPPFVLPQLTHHGRLVDITQKNGYAPFFQSLIVAETSP